MGSSDEEKDKKVRYVKPKEFEVKYLKYKAKYLKVRSMEQQTGGGNDLSKWIHQEGANVNGTTIEKGPVAYYPKIVEKYGPPTYCVNEPGGVCRWIAGKTEKDIFPHAMIVLEDEFVHHTKPAEHYDFMYSISKVYVPPESLVDVLKISGSINYDPLLKHLRARCGSFAANFATFRTVFDVLGKKDSDYGENIGKKEQEEESNEEYVTRKVKENQEKYSDELTQPFYDIQNI